MNEAEQIELLSEIHRTRQAHFTEVLRLENEINRLDLLETAVARNQVSPELLEFGRPSTLPGCIAPTIPDCINAVLPDMPDRFKLEDLRTAVERKFPGLKFTLWSFYTSWLRVRRKNRRIGKVGRGYFYQYLEKAA